MDKKDMMSLLSYYLDDWGHLGKDIMKLAKENKKEYTVLLDMFNKEEELGRKLSMSDFLVEFDCEDAIEFLIKLINDDNNEMQTVSYGGGWSHDHNKICAAGKLIRASNSNGKNFIKRFIKIADEDQQKWIGYVLYSRGAPGESSLMGLKLLIELAEKYEVINNYVCKHKEGITKIMRELEEIN